MDVRGGCFNCGMVDYYRLPYRSMIAEFDKEDAAESHSHYHVDGDDRPRPWLCGNCGWDRMIVLYHDNLKSSEPLKSAEVEIVRGINGS